MSRTVIVEMKSSRLGHSKTITRSFEHEVRPRQRVLIETETTKNALSTPNNQSKQSSLISETFKPQAFK
jgi:hypothetical protein